MRSRFLLVKLITGTIVAALAFVQAIDQVSAKNSDWIDDNDVSEFNIPRPEDPNDSSSNQRNQQIPVERNQASPTDERNNSEDQREPSDEQPIGPRKKEYNPPPNTVIKDVTDAGGVELGPDGRPRNTRAPLEASISTTRPGYSDDDGSGIDRRSEQLMARAPRLANPRPINADPKAFKAWLTSTHPGVLENATRDQIIEIKGEWDDSAHALRTFGIPYTRIPSKKFSEVNLDRVKIVVVNCEGHLPMEALLSLRRYVAMGGYLLTTDWALENVVEKAFPNTVKWCQGSYTSDEANQVVDTVIVGNQDPDLIAGIAPVGHWQLVKKSQIAQIVNPQKVHVLARTRMMREDPNNLGVLCCVIEHGNGKVMHLVGHFDNNSDQALNTSLIDPAPGMPLSLRQALAANFIAQALQRGVEPSAAAGTSAKSTAK